MSSVASCAGGNPRRPLPIRSLAHTVEHLQSVFPQSVCPLSEFQLAFQCALMG